MFFSVGILLFTGRLSGGENIILQKNSDNWHYTIKYPSSPPEERNGKKWYEEGYDDSDWLTGKMPFGYGDEPRAKYGTKLPDIKGSYYFRKIINLDDIAKYKKICLKVASDNAAVIYINGKQVYRDPLYGVGCGHEFCYWNAEKQVNASGILKKGDNLIAVGLYNNPGSSDAYLDLQIEDFSFPLQAVSYPAEYERDNQFYIIKGELGHLLFWFEGDKKKIKEPQLIIDLPQFLRLVYAWHQSQEGPAGVVVDISKRNSRHKNYYQYIISLNEDLLRSKLPGKKYLFSPTTLAILLECNPEAKEQSLPVYWHISNNKIHSQEKRIDANILPALVVNLPERFKFYIWDTTLLGCPDEKYRNRLLSLYKKIGIRGGMGVRHKKRLKIDQELIRKGWEIYIDPDSWGGWGGGFWSVNANQLTDKPEDVLITLRNGKKTKRKWNLCPTFMIENGKEGQVYFEKAKKYIERSYFKGITGFVQDYEMSWKSEVSPANSCFCPRCKRAFYKFSGIDVTNLAGEEILLKYMKEWYKFRYWQNAKMMDIFTHIVKSIDPKLKSIVCSTPIMRNRLSYPFDIRDFDSWIDEHWPQYYRTGVRHYKWMQIAEGQLKKPVVATLNTCFPVGEHWALSSNDVKLNTLVSAIFGCRGVCYFTGSISLDGDYIKAIGEAADIISKLEDFFLNGKRIDSVAKVKGAFLKNLSFYKFHKLDNRYLLSMVNYHSSKDEYLDIRLFLPKGEYQIYDPISMIALYQNKKKKFYTSEDLKKGIIYIIPPQDIKFLIIAPSYLKVNYKSSIYEKVIKEKYNLHKTKKEVFKNIKKGRLSIASADMEKDGIKEILISTPEQKVYISPCYGGRIWSWQINGRELSKRNFNEADKAGVLSDQFWRPREIERRVADEEYEILNYKITKEGVFLKLQKKCAYKSIKGLQINKEYFVPESGTEIKVKYSFKNTSRKNIEFSFWSHSMPFFANIKGIGRENDEVFFIIPATDGIKKIRDDAGEIVFNAVGTEKDKGFWKGRGYLKEPWFAKWNKTSREAIFFNLDGEKLLQIYCCASVNPATAEWMYKTYTLKPGQIWNTVITLLYTKVDNISQIINVMSGNYGENLTD